MRKHITVLVNMGHIYGIERSEWMSKATLAPKLHQVTRVWAFPVPRCDDASMYEFDDGRKIWLFDCPMGYHQVEVNERSRLKLAFAGPDADLYTYRVMPFGLVNGPEIFIRLIHDINQDWQTLALTRGVLFYEDTNTRIIVDDLFNHALDDEIVFTYMEAQLEVSALRRLSLSLPKSRFFVERVEFVGVDISESYNMPARSKHELVRSWPKPNDIRAVALFIAFGMFYSKWIPYFEIKVQPLRKLTNDYGWDVLVTPDMWSDEAEGAWNLVIDGILSDPCLVRWDSRRRFYLQTDFCALGMAFVGMQPASDTVSLDAMRREMEGGVCEFLRDPPKDKPSAVMPQLKPVCFGSRRCKGYETKLHSYLGEGFTGDWGLSKTSHYLWGLRNTWITDQYTLLFLLTYDGDNAPVRRL